jgi:hypothetical protein
MTDSFATIAMSMLHAASNNGDVFVFDIDDIGIIDVNRIDVTYARIAVNARVSSAIIEVLEIADSRDSIKTTNGNVIGSSVSFMESPVVVNSANRLARTIPRIRRLSLRFRTISDFQPIIPSDFFIIVRIHHTGQR